VTDRTFFCDARSFSLGRVRRRSERGGLIRDRLVGRLAGAVDYDVALVVAPAGSGKSRLLAHAAAAHDGPVAWCGTPDPMHRTAEAFIAGVATAIESSATVPGAGGAFPRSVDGLVEMLQAAEPTVLVVLDDVHLIEGTEAGAALEDFAERIPPSVRLVLASRVSPALDLSGLRVAGRLVEVGPDDLRFRTWEVEELFRDVYRDPLLPEDVGALARRTGGWAAYLQLFFLATNRKPHAERRRMLGSIASRSRLVSEYLGRHVLAGLSPELQEFLLRTSVLRRPTAELCDELLGSERGSAAMLEELERRRVFTERVDDDAYRYHAVLLSYLESQLVETLGAAGAAREHQRAGALLERAGWMEDALAAFAKSEDWDGVARILGDAETSTSGLGDGWIEALPPTVVTTDALLQLVRARRAMARGALRDAAQILREAEAVAVSAAVAERCRIEKERVLSWLERSGTADVDWCGAIRQATRGQPVEAHRQAVALPGVAGRFAEGLTAYLAGDMATAMRVMRAVCSHPDAVPAMASGARLVGVLAGFMAGAAPAPDDIDRLREEVEESGIPWLDRVTRAALRMVEGGALPVADFVDACEREADRWGAALIAFFGGIARMRAGEQAAALMEQAADAFAELGAGVLAASALSYAALAAWRAGDHPAATRLVRRARALAVICEAPLAVGSSTLVKGLVLGDDEEVALAREILEPLGTWVWHVSLTGVPGSGLSDEPGPRGESAGATVPVESVVRLRCLGGFSLSIGGVVVDESAAKPMERGLLHLLAMMGGEPVHREVLVTAFWPGADVDAGVHRLQVAVSSLRRLLSAAGADGVQLLPRKGESYALDLPRDADSDVRNLERAVHDAATARTRGDVMAERMALSRALAAHAGPLLPADGPAEWVVARREAIDMLYIEAATRLAALHLQADEATECSEIARAALAVDRYRDELWKLLIEAAEQAGKHAEAARARKDYAAVLEELGVERAPTGVRGWNVTSP